MHDMTCNIWGRELVLNIEFDVYPGEEILDMQHSALNDFMKAAPELLADDTQIKEYCYANNPDEVDKEILNIFKYVKPNTLFIRRTTEKRSVVLFCDYKPDLEHGIGILFEDELLTDIGPQDKYL